MIKRSGCLIGTAAAGMWLRLVLINAASPWIDEVNEACDLPHKYGISKVGSIHIVINRALVPDCMFLQTVNRPICFIISWGEGGTFVGTRTEDCFCSEEFGPK